jgi:hypothetical protein
MNLEVRLSVRRVVALLAIVSLAFIIIDATMNTIEWNRRHTLERGYAEVGDLGCAVGGSCFAPRQPESLSVTFEKLRMRFDYDLEANVPTWYSSFLFSLCALTLIVIGLRSGQTGVRNVVPWFGLAAIFFYFSIDDTSQFHELLGGDNSIGHNLNKHLGLAFITYDWVIPAFILMIAALPFFIPFGLKLPQGTFVLFVVAAFLFLFSQMGLETFAGSHLTVDTLKYHWESLIEDGPMKQGALILFVFSMLAYYRDNLQGALTQHRVVADLPVIRQVLSLPVLRLLRPEVPAMAAR